MFCAFAQYALLKSQVIIPRFHFAAGYAAISCVCCEKWLAHQHLWNSEQFFNKPEMKQAQIKLKIDIRNVWTENYLIFIK